jgi:two-component sensor histidine kinase
MALIHDILFQSRDIANIDFSEYIKNISTQLLRSYGAFSKKIDLIVQANKIILDVDTAIPCGLIVTELVSNSLKHAFVDGREEQISIQFSENHEGTLALIVSDNGIGFPKDADLASIESLGLKLVTALVSQLSGTVELDRLNRTAFKITFADENRQQRENNYDTRTNHGC